MYMKENNIDLSVILVVLIIRVLLIDKIHYLYIYDIITHYDTVQKCISYIVILKGAIVSLKL